MRARLGHARTVQDDDEVGHPHGAESVRDEDRDLAMARIGRAAGAIASHRVGITLEQGVLGLGVERRRGFVEHEEQGDSRMKPAPARAFATARS